MLTVVEREQHPPRPERVGEGVNQRAARFPDHPDGRCHPRDDQLGLPQVAELHEPDSIREVAGDGGQDLQGQPRLADTAGAAERERPRAIEDAAQVGQFQFPPDEPIRFLGQVN